MTTSASSVGLIFGIPNDEDLPRLPSGFSFIKSPKDWLMAEDENGGRWWVCGYYLARCGIATAGDVMASQGRLSLGERFFDSRQSISFDRETGEVIR